MSWAAESTRAPVEEGDGSELPTFPRGALLLSLAAILLIGVVGFSVNWMVGDYIRTITRSQLKVLTSAEQVKQASAEKELTLRLAAATGDLADLERVAVLQRRLQSSLVNLEQAIQLPENRVAFSRAFEAENQLRVAEQRQALLIEAGRLGEARWLANRPSQQDLQETFIARIAEIGARSRSFIEASRAKSDRLLQLNMLTNVLAAILIAGALFLMFLPTRRWGQELARMHGEAASAGRAKADFLAAMSHEIRTPLNGVIGFADLLLDDPTLRPGHRRQIGLIQSAGSMLLTIVNDILDLSKVEAGKVEIANEPFAIEALIDEVLSILRPTVDIKKIQLSSFIDSGLSHHYRGDCGRLRQILLNLLNNAVKFTERGSVIVTVERGRRGVCPGGDEIVISVCDSGIGIAADRIGNLFQPFTQADSEIGKRFGGTGLGLSICRGLLDLMGGHVQVESKLGSGSTFRVTLPLQRSDAPTFFADEESPKGAPSRVLLVEDLPMNREIAGAILARAGHSVDFAETGEKAVAMAAASNYDLVLMDIQMPGIDGVEAARRIRALPKPRGLVPILAMTANTLPAQIRGYSEAGMDGHVAKPIKADVLEQAISRTLLGHDLRWIEPENESALPMFDAEIYAKVSAIMPSSRLHGHISALVTLVQKAANLAEDDANLESCSHMIASQAGALGLLRLADCARKLEDACHSGANIHQAALAFAGFARDIDALSAFASVGNGELRAKVSLGTRCNLDR